MLYEVLVAGRYSTFEAGGRRGARRREVGEVVEFPGDYGQGLMEAGLVREVEGSQIGMGISAAIIRARMAELESMGLMEDGSVGVEATAAARKLAEAEGVQLGEVEATGKEGRVTVGDVRRVVRQRDF